MIVPVSICQWKVVPEFLEYAIIQLFRTFCDKKRKREDGDDAYDEDLYMSKVWLDACGVQAQGRGMLQMWLVADDNGKS